MPLGRILRLVGRVLPGPIGTAAGAVGGAIGAVSAARRSGNRMTAAATSAIPEPEKGPPTVPVPTPPVVHDTFDNTGTAVGTAVGAAIGSRFGPAGTAVGAGIGGAVGNRLGNALPVPFGGGNSPNPTDAASQFALLSNFGARGSKAHLEMLLYSGALRNIMRQPLVYQLNDGTGRVRYGSDPGFVLITRKSGGQTIRFQLPKIVAQKLGFWKPRRKPIISVRDSNAIRRAARAKARLNKVAKESGLDCRMTKRCAPARKTTRTRRTR